MATFKNYHTDTKCCFSYEKTLKWFWWFRSFLTHQCLLLSEASATITCLFVNKHNLCFPINAKRSHRRGFNSAGALVYPWENNILHHANKNKNTITNISTNTTMNTNASTSSNGLSSFFQTVSFLSKGTRTPDSALSFHCSDHCSMLQQVLPITLSVLERKGWMPVNICILNLPATTFMRGCNKYLWNKWLNVLNTINSH